MNKKNNKKENPLKNDLRIYERYIKRFQDFLLSGVALIVLSPVILLVAILVRVKLGSPVIFKQERPGLNKKIFTLYKFRTMTNEIDVEGNLLSDDKRLTKFGKFLRSTSLDELPELINILRGDMSIVGPRPLLVRYLPFYNEEQSKRHSVRPGLTGLAQIYGRNNLTWEKTFELDVKYVKKITFIGDWKIIFSTVGPVFKRENIAANDPILFDEYVKEMRSLDAK